LDRLCIVFINVGGTQLKKWNKLSMRILVVSINVWGTQLEKGNNLSMSVSLNNLKIVWLGMIEGKLEVYRSNHRHRRNFCECGALALQKENLVGKASIFNTY